MLNKLKLRLRALFHNTAMERELDEELRFHLEKEIEKNLACGMNAEEARLAALRSFGGVERRQEKSRDARGVRFLAEFWRDLCYGTRILRQQPSFTLIVVLTLALGIGANTAIFSLVKAVLLSPFPYQAPERLVSVQERFSAPRGITVSYPNFVDWRAQNTAFASIAAVRGSESFNFTGRGEPERLQGRLVSAEFFSTLGITPVAGRDFRPEDDGAGAAPAVILSYGFWQRRFGEDESIVGKQLVLNQQSFTVIGIAPQDFQYGVEADVTVPIGLQAERF